MYFIFRGAYANSFALFQTPSTAYPTVVFESSWTVQVDGVRIACSSDFDEALAVMMACHWVLNLEFASSIKKTLSFLACLLDLPGVKTPLSVVRVMNKLKQR